MAQGIFNQSLSLVVPIYNEIDLLASSVANFDAFLKEHFADYEIILIESGSTDGSAEEADRLANQYSRIKVIHEQQRSGFGSAVRLGYRSASKEFVLVETVDLPFSMDSILKAFPVQNGCDAILSSRSHDCRGWYRRLQSSCFNSLVKACLRLEVNHINSAFKLVRTSIATRLPLISTGWLIDAELIYRLKQNHLKYDFISVDLRPRPGGKSSIKWTTSLKIIFDLIVFLIRKDKVDSFAIHKNL